MIFLMILLDFFSCGGFLAHDIPKLNWILSPWCGKIEHGFIGWKRRRWGIHEEILELMDQVFHHQAWWTWNYRFPWWNLVFFMLTNFLLSAALWKIEKIPWDWQILVIFQVGFRIPMNHSQWNIASNLPNSSAEGMFETNRTQTPKERRTRKKH